MLNDLDRSIAQAIIGIDTLWGGDVMNPSGMGRFIADSWFSDEPLPDAYDHPAAARLRETGGVGPKEDSEAVDTFIRDVDVRGSILNVLQSGRELGGLRGQYLENLGLCFDLMWDLAMELHGKGEPVPYDRCVETILGRAPEPSDPTSKKEQLLELLRDAGYDPADPLEAVDDWRSARMVASPTIASLGDAFIARYDALTVRNVLPYLPQQLTPVPRANVKFLPIENAWFSGSMNYLGRARKKDGSPEYEASYELNAALQISVPEFQQLVSHEVVPGHVTTFAYLQNLYHRHQLGFEATVLTMNTRVAALFEGIANNAILMAYGVTEISDLPDRDLQIGVLLALLQDDAKNQSSFLTWKEGLEKEEVAKVLRNDFLVSEERADKLSGAWGRHPLLGRMYLPAYRAGTELVADLRRRYRPERVLPALYGCRGVVDLTTVEQAIAS
jgi:hypothetical protein